MDPLVDLTFSHSGKYFCASSKELISIWHIEDYERKNINLSSKLTIGMGCNDQEIEDAEGIINIITGSRGISGTLFNSTDELLLVNGLKMVPNVDEYPLEDFRMLIYSFPGLLPVRRINMENHFVDRVMFPSWFGQTSFIAAEKIPGGTSHCIVIHSAVSKNSKTLLEFQGEVFHVDIINHSTTGNKMLVFSFQDDFDQFNPYAHNNLVTYVVTSDCKVVPHTCNTSIEKETGLIRDCCIDSKFVSPELEHYSCSEWSKNTVCVDAALGHSDTKLVPGAICVVCEPYQITPEALKYSNVEFRVYDLDLNMLRVLLDLANAVQFVRPDIFLMSNYWIDPKQCNIMISVDDCNPGVLQYYDFHYKIFIRKKTGHVQGINCSAFNPTNPNFLVTVSYDCVMKFWDVS